MVGIEIIGVPVQIGNNRSRISDYDDNTADAIGALGMSFFLDLPKPGPFEKHYASGRKDCAKAGFSPLPYRRNPNWRVCAWMDGWCSALKENYKLAGTPLPLYATIGKDEPREQWLARLKDPRYHK